tara:strand:- start:1529 stop:2857 length:1329 start_codon:yes stop_codon:yes gene_type:complete
MADTKWLDPSGWTLLDWEDTTKTVLVDFLWSALKGAADERQAYFEASHSGGFNSDKSFPDFSEFKSLLDNLVSSPNNAEKIASSIFPYSTNLGASVPAGPVDHNSFAVDGTAVTNSVRPTYLELTTLLTDILGYASSNLLHMIDTDDGSDTALLKMTWLVQWYQALNYPQYYAFPLGNAEFKPSIMEEVQYIPHYGIEILYGYNNDDSQAGNCSLAELTEPFITSTEVDFYTAGDLKDSVIGDYSTPQEVYDYGVSKFNEFYGNSQWQTIGDPSLIAAGLDVETLATMYMDRGSSDTFTNYDLSIKQSGRIRFKIKDGFRSLSPEKFSQLVYSYFYMTKISLAGDSAEQFYSDFGAGISADETQFKQFTADADGYYYFNIKDPDLTNFLVPTRPTTFPARNRRVESNALFTLSDSVSLGVSRHVILTKPNKDDDTNFHYYTP